MLKIESIIPKAPPMPEVKPSRSNEVDYVETIGTIWKTGDKLFKDASVTIVKMVYCPEFACVDAYFSNNRRARIFDIEYIEFV